MKRGLRNGAAWTLAGNVGYSVCQYGILMVIAKVGSASQLGQFALGLAVATPVMMMTNLQLRSVLATDATSEYPVGAYVSLRLVGVSAALLTITAIACRYEQASRSVIVLVGVAKSVEAVGDIVQGVLQRAERFRRMAASLLWRGVTSLVLCAVLLGATRSLVVAVLGLALDWAAVVVTLDLPAARAVGRLRVLWEPRSLRRLVCLAFPLGAVTSLLSLTTNVPRYAIEANLGTASLGHFAAMAYLMVAATQPILAIGVAASPQLGAAFVQDRAQYRRLVGRMLGIGGGLALALVIGTACVGRQVVAFAFGAAYGGEGSVLNWLAVGTGLGFVTSVLGYALTAARCFKAQLWIAVASLVVCVLATRVLVPQYGLRGATWAVVLTECCRLVLFAVTYASVARIARAMRGLEREPVRPHEKVVALG